MSGLYIIVSGLLTDVHHYKLFRYNLAINYLDRSVSEHRVTEVVIERFPLLLFLL